MKILVLSSRFPWPADTGGKLRIFHLVRCLAERHQVTFLSFARSGSVAPERLAVLAEHARVLAPVVLPPPGLLGRTNARWRSEEMRAQIREALRRERFDLVLSAEILAGYYGAEIEGIPRILDNCELGVFLQRCADPRLFRRLLYRREWRRKGSFTASVAARHDACTVVSDGEQTSLESILPAGAMVRVVPNGADVQGQRGDFGDPEPDSLVYPGALTYHANLDAMEYFLERIFPLLRSRRPAVILRITGEPGRAGRRLVARRGAGVVLTGPLEDVRPCVATSRVCVIPLRIGGGTRVKILEAMALGTPVVATPKGAEGLHVADGNDLLIARPPEDFAVAVRRLLEDESLRWRIADTARRTVAEQYDWRLCLRPLEELHGELVSAGWTRRARTA